LAGHHSGHFRLDPEARLVGFSHGEKTVGLKLYVGNLSYDVNNASLEEMFTPFGAVRSAQVIQDRDTGRSKGFGFVEMADDNAARAAMTGLNGKEMGGRALAVNEAKPREDRGGGGGGGGGGGRRGSFSRR
jgi:RNA recognition motif-containing protein